MANRDVRTSPPPGTKRLLSPNGTNLLPKIVNRMRHFHRLCVFSIAFGLFVASAATAQTGSPKPESWLLQSLHLTGSPVEGFKKTCLVVYQNGDFHREQRRQFSESGRAQYEWQAPEVFEGKLTGDDLNAFEAILGNPEFLGLSGAVGSGRDLWSQLVFNRRRC